MRVHECSFFFLPFDCSRWNRIKIYNSQHQFLVLKCDMLNHDSFQLYILSNNSSSILSFFVAQIYVDYNYLSSATIILSR